MLIKKKINKGVYTPGARIPTERVLCEKYDISRAPVRQALTELVQEGYIRRQSGRGTFVQAREPDTLERRVTLRLLAYDVRWVTLMEGAVQHWNELHPNRTLRLEVNMPSQSEFHQKLCASMGSTEAPDIVSIDYVWVTRYARLGFLASLDELDPEFAAWLRSELERPVLQNHLLDGGLYGVPVQADVSGLWYRRDWFEAEGLEPPQTWETWLAQLDYFAQDDVKARLGHVYPISFPISTFTGEATLNLLFPLIWTAGGRLIDDAGRPALDDPVVIRVLEFLQKIVLERHYLPDKVGTFHWWDSTRMIATEQVPMMLGGSYAWPTIAEEADGSKEEVIERFGFVPAPRPSKARAPVLSLGGTTWAVMRESEHYELSLEILRMSMDLDMVVSFCERELQISSLKSANRRLVAGDNPWLQSVVPLLSLARPRPMLENYVQVSRILQQMFEMALVDGLPAEQAVRQTARTLELLLDY